MYFVFSVFSGRGMEVPLAFEHVWIVSGLRWVDTVSPRLCFWAVWTNTNKTTQIDSPLLMCLTFLVVLRIRICGPLHRIEVPPVQASTQPTSWQPEEPIGDRAITALLGCEQKQKECVAHGIFLCLMPFWNHKSCDRFVCIPVRHQIGNHLVKLPCFKSNLVAVTVRYESLAYGAVELHVWSNQEASSMTRTLIEATHHCHLHSLPSPLTSSPHCSPSTMGHLLECKSFSHWSWLIPAQQPSELKI